MPFTYPNANYATIQYLMLTDHHNGYNVVVLIF